MSRIFWLDDEFDFLGDILQIGSKYGLTKQSLLEKVTFAFDYEMGAAIVSKEQFDVYILDSDFFRRTPKEFKNNANKLLQKVTKKMRVIACQHVHPKRLDLYKRFGYRDCLFVDFYKKHLEQRNARTVIFSVSFYAPVVAYHLGLPFYAKAWTKEVLQKSVEADMFDAPPLRYLPANIRKPKDFLKCWEFGSLEELVKRYLMT